MSDPNAKAGITEMLAVAKARDLAAMIIVHGPSQMEFDIHLKTSWGCAWVEPDEGKGMQLRIKSKLVDYPDKETQKKAMEATVGMFLSSTEALSQWVRAFAAIARMLGKEFDIEHMTKVEEQTKVTLGSTGDYPQGKLNPEDEGALRFAVRIEDGKIRLDFGKPVAWLAMDKDLAYQLAAALVQRAGTL